MTTLRISSLLFTLILVASLTGCLTTRTIPTSLTTYPPNEPNCKVAIVSIPPDMTQYEEIGEISIGANSVSYATLAERFREQACGIGGDLVLKDVNGLGQVIRGIVFRRN